LDLKVIIQKQEYELGSYDVLPCGQAMTLCNNAFIDLSNRFEDILSTSFEESPRGDKKRVFKVGDNLIRLIANSFYSLTWLNSKYANQTKPGMIDFNNQQQVESVSQSATLKVFFDKAIKTFEQWVSNKTFQSCAFCDTCGGDYPINGGGGVSSFTWKSYGPSCSGSIYNT
jgi:hypothetical protein